jgi:hypothetical protein
MGGFTHETPDGKAQTVDWWTPQWVFDAMGIEFDLDPCAPPGGVPWIPAKSFYSPPQDGLAEPWFGTVWCNPPYGDQTTKWLKKMAQHGDGVALVFARTDTAWFHDIIVHSDAFLLLRGRISFVPGNRPSTKQTSGAGSLLVAWGDKSVAALKNMADHGCLIGG